jgi:hypothetical protein
MPPRWDPTWDGRKNGNLDGKKDGHFPQGRRPGRRGSVVFVPYYVPYSTIYMEPVVGSSQQASSVADAAGSGYASTQPRTEVPGATSRPAPALTVLVFKDRTLVMVRDYWLEGERLWYETSDGVVASIFLDQLDLPFTQQLNRERSVRFVLESRP